MKIIICGAGQVGGQIARHLAAEDNQVTVIDSNPELVRRLTEANDIAGLTGFASHPDILEMAGARDCDMVIAATHSDEVNMVICQVAHSIFEVPRKIARLRARAYFEAIYSDLYRRDHLPIDVVISPERAVAEALMQRLASPAAFDTESFLDGQAQLVGIGLDAACPVLNTPLRHLSELFPTLRAVVVGIRREGRLFVPKPEDQLFEGDQIYLTCVTADLPRAMEIFGKRTQVIGTSLVIGAGQIGLEVCQRLERAPRRIRTRIIEMDRARAEAAADRLERTVVLHGDGLDLEILEEANIAHTDVFMAVTDDDKTNLLSCTRAKAAGVRLVIALVNDPSLIGLMKPLGIDAYVNPRAITVSSILRYVRHGRIRAVYSVGDADAEMLEAQVLSTSPIAGQRLRDIEWPEDSIVGMVHKGGSPQVPRGDTRIEEGDVLLVFARRGVVGEVEQQFQVGMEFF